MLAVEAVLKELIWDAVPAALAEKLADVITTTETADMHGPIFERRCD